MARRTFAPSQLRFPEVDNELEKAIKMSLDSMEEEKAIEKSKADAFDEIKRKNAILEAELCSVHEQNAMLMQQNAMLMQQKCDLSNVLEIMKQANETHKATIHLLEAKLKLVNTLNQASKP